MPMIRGVRGAADILPGEVGRWQRVEVATRRILENYGYQEIRTPIFERTELFVRGIGEGTDIVEKQMYTFEDRGKESLTLRPEGTAPVIRACLEHHLLTRGGLYKVYYTGPMFRHERPQAGRFRQFHQIGAEAIGVEDPALDAEVLAVPIHQLIPLLGLEEYSADSCHALFHKLLFRLFRKGRMVGLFIGSIETNKAYLGHLLVFPKELAGFKHGDTRRTINWKAVNPRADGGEC